MRRSSSITVTGLDGCIGALTALGKRIAKQGADKALRAASKPITQAIRAEVPVETGSLRKSIGLKLKSYPRSRTRMSIIGARSKRYDTAAGKRNPAYYAHLVEFGVKPHNTRKKGLRNRFRKPHQHPGHKGVGAFKRGFDSAGPAAQAALVRTLREVVESKSTPTTSKGPDEA